MQRPSHDPKPVKRRFLLRAAAKLVGTCPECHSERPLHPDTGICWPCDDLGGPRAAQDREKLPHGEMCNDCAFRKGSPEQVSGGLDPVMLMAKHGGGIFWCHKPFLEPEQQWGYDRRERELIPLHGDHWRACAGFCGVFNREWGTR